MAIQARNSNIELLRIIAMLSIVMSHIIFHGIPSQLLEQSSSLIGKRYFILNTIYSWGTISNNIFIIISGYFMVQKGNSINLIKISKKLLFQLIYATVALVFISNIIFRISNFNSKIVIENFFTINERSWFIGYYYLILIIATIFLNNYLLGLNRSKYFMLLIATFSIIQFSWSLNFLNGFSNKLGLLATGIFLYSFGGALKIYNPFEKIRSFTLILLISCSYFIIYLTSINLKKILIPSDSGLLGIVIAICLFELFKRIRIPSVNIINFVGASTFMVYLFHDSSFFYSLWKLNDWLTLLINTPFLFIQQMIIWGTITFGFGVVCYISYLLFIKIIKKSQNLFLKS